MRDLLNRQGEKGMLKTLTNEEIYLINEQLNNSLTNNDSYLPARVNFYIQKNKKKIANLASEIEETRAGIVMSFGEPAEEEGKYFIPQDRIKEAQQELDDLLSIEQEVDIQLISIDDLETLQFTLPQMEALMFMIEE
jgi:hypothetical protein